MARNLLLTLGHNSSAILVEDDKIICGYEEERLSKVKSDSAFPKLAIMQCLNYKYTPSLENIYISYWNDQFDIFERQSTPDKHIDKKFLETLCKHYGCKIKYLSEDFTHHDAHAYGALNFFENHATEEEKSQDFHVIVSDGFGNKEEVFSLYHHNGDKLEKLLKIQGYEQSMGLMYQYATSFCGMKENEDEYKFLGYESHIKEVLSDEQIQKLYDYSNSFISTMVTEALAKQFNDHTWTDYIDVSKLISVKNYWCKKYNDVLALVGFSKDKDDIEKIRCIIATFIQNNIEQFVGQIAKKYGVKNVILAGGIFYNVKLNNFIMNSIEGKICVFPLAGDQGCGIGCYRYYNQPLKFNDLFFGKRDLTISYDEMNELKKSLPEGALHHFEYYSDRSIFVARVTELLKKDQIVNILTGSMEFGPRALCSTTTLAQPTDHNFKYINTLNGRNAVMPFAPCILESQAKKYFGLEQVNRIIGSNSYMIITMDHLIHERTAKYTGILHKYPLKDVYSSRCQFIPDNADWYIAEVLKGMTEVNDFFIQTSHNAHGRPILYSVFDVVRNHIFTAKQDSEDRSYTLVGAF